MAYGNIIVESTLDQLQQGTMPAACGDEVDGPGAQHPTTNQTDHGNHGEAAGGVATVVSFPSPSPRRRTIARHLIARVDNETLD